MLGIEGPVGAFEQGLDLRVEGRTGRGDTCTAAFLVGLQRGEGLESALELAARASIASISTASSRNRSMSSGESLRSTSPPGTAP